MIAEAEFVSLWWNDETTTISLMRFFVASGFEYLGRINK